MLEWTAGFLGKREVDSPPAGAAEMLLGARALVPADTASTRITRRRCRTRAPGGVPGAGEAAGNQEPIAYLTGRAPFFNLDLAVT